MERGKHQTEGRVIHWARFYDPLIKVLTMGREKEMREEFLDLAGVGPGERVLDVGCGTGNLTLWAKERVGEGGKVSGIDPAPEMIEAARDKSVRAGVDIELRTGIIEDIPFPEDSFDVVLSSFMVHHLPEEVKRAGFAEVRRVLAPEGRLLVVDIEPAGLPLLGALFTHLIGHGKIRGNINALPALLKKAGFDGVEVGRTTFSPVSFALARKKGLA
jgi:ubiquinone/menaquinone biosynthesis C-methylase UbiE